MTSGDQKRMVKIFKALANIKRVEALTHLKKHRILNVSGVAEKINLSLRSTSKHLLKLEEAGLVNRNQNSRDIYYSIADGFATEVITTFARMSE